MNQSACGKPAVWQIKLEEPAYTAPAPPLAEFLRDNGGANLILLLYLYREVNTFALETI
jgi:hypothetical protein